VKLVLAYVLGILILLPVAIFILSFLFFRKLLKKQVNSSFRLAADITTFVLFFSVTISITTLWGAPFSIVTISISLLIAMIMTYIDWRTQKEIEVVPLLRRIWRMQFLYLLIVYNIVWIVGIVQSVIFFVT